MSQTRERKKHRSAVRDGAPAIELKSLGLRYGQQEALVDLSLQVAAGERIAVVGPNGAGKSTLFHLLAGVIAPTSGELRIHGHLPTRFLCTAYVTQSRQLDWNFPVCVADVVMMGRAGLLGLLRRPGAKDWAEVNSALERMGISELAEQEIGKLSAGQKQRMFIARALAQEAELLLLDEPLAGMDLSSRELLFEIMEEVSAAGVTVLVATHDLNLAEERFDRILLINHKLISFGKAEKVLSPAHLGQAYGGQVQVVKTSEGRKILGDMGGHHAHDEEGAHG